MSNTPPPRVSTATMSTFLDTITSTSSTTPRPRRRYLQFFSIEVPPSCLRLHSKMSDGKKSSNTHSSGGKSQSKGASRVALTMSKLFKLAAQVEEITKDVEGVEQYEELIETQRGLKRQIEEKKEEITEKDKALVKMQSELGDETKKSETLLESFGEKFKELHELERQVAVLERSNAHVKEDLDKAIEEKRRQHEAEASLRDTLKHQDLELRRVKERASKLGQTYKEHKKLVEDKDTQIHDLTGRCKQLQNDVGDGVLRYVPHSTIEKRFSAMAEDLHNLVMEYILDSKEVSKSALDNLADQRSHTLRLSKTSTKHARLLRCAAAESVIASALTQHIFKDFYMPETPELGNAMTIVLDLLETPTVTTTSSSSSLDTTELSSSSSSSTINSPGDSVGGRTTRAVVSRRQNVVRAQLLAHHDAVCPAPEILHKQIVEKALDAVSPVLNPFLPATSLSDFRVRLEALFSKAVVFWAGVQRNTQRCSVYSTRGRGRASLAATATTPNTVRSRTTVSVTAMGGDEEDFAIDVEDRGYADGYGPATDHDGDMAATWDEEPQWDEEEDAVPDYHSRLPRTEELNGMREQKIRADEVEVLAVLFPQVVCEGKAVFGGRAVFSTHRVVMGGALERCVSGGGYGGHGGQVGGGRGYGGMGGSRRRRSMSVQHQQHRQNLQQQQQGQQQISQSSSLLSPESSLSSAGSRMGGRVAGSSSSGGLGHGIGIGGDGGSVATGATSPPASLCGGGGATMEIGCLQGQMERVDGREKGHVVSNGRGGKAEGEGAGAGSGGSGGVPLNSSGRATKSNKS